MDSICNYDTNTLPSYDDTLPLPADVERAFLRHAGDGVSAETVTWLQDNDIDPESINSAALIQYGLIWNPEAGRYDFLIYGPDHIGPKHGPALAVPISEGGEFIDLLLVGAGSSSETVLIEGESIDLVSYDQSYCMVTCRTPWLGRENIAAQSVRLHAHPMDWLEAGCTGACHIALISRKALKELRAAKSIVCNDIEAALQAWDWGFGADDKELARFEVDDTPESIRRYVEEKVQWRVLHRLRMEGLPVYRDPESDPEFDALIEKMRSEYVYATETHS